GEMFKRNLFGLVAFCRVAPGVDFIAFIACGWVRVPLGRFLAATLIVSALYLPLMLYLVVVFGDALDDHLGLWAWPVLLVALSVTAFVRYRVFAVRDLASEEGLPVERAHSVRRYRPNMSDKGAAVARLRGGDHKLAVGMARRLRLP